MSNSRKESAMWLTLQRVSSLIQPFKGCSKMLNENGVSDVCLKLAEQRSNLSWNETCLLRREKEKVLNLWSPLLWIWRGAMVQFYIYSTTTTTGPTGFVICHQLSAMWHELRAFFIHFPTNFQVDVVISQKIMTPFFFFPARVLPPHCKNCGEFWWGTPVIPSMI